MSEQPVVSICIPSYNHARFLPTAIESALGQTYKHLEIVIVDDGSTDGSLQIAEAYAARHPDVIRLYTHPQQQNLGVAATANLARRMMRGAYWSGLCSDDVLYPDKVARQVALLEAHPEVGWVYSYAHFIDETGGRRPEMGLFGSDLTRHANPLERLIEVNVIPAMTILVRHSCLEQVGREDTAVLYSDWEQWVRLLARWPVIFMPEALVQYRIHSSNMSVGIERAENMRRGIEVLEAIQRKAAVVGGDLLRPRVQALVALQLAYLHFVLHDLDAAATHLRAAFAADPALGADAAYLTDWLQRRFRELAQGLPTPPGARAFPLWLLAHLPASVEPACARALQRRIAGPHFGGLAARWQRTGAYLRPRQRALGYLLREPAAWRDPHLLAACGETLVGSRLSGRLRQLLSRPGPGAPIEPQPADAVDKGA